MAENKEFPKVILKRNKIQTMVDYCLDETIEFTVRQQQFPDTDWEVEIKIDDIKAAVMLGMFLRENRLELEGMETQKNNKKTPQPKSNSKSNGNGSSKSADSSSKPVEDEVEEKEKEKKETQAGDLMTAFNEKEKEEESNDEKKDDQPSFLGM